MKQHPDVYPKVLRNYGWRAADEYWDGYGEYAHEVMAEYGGYNYLPVHIREELDQAYDQMAVFESFGFCTYKHKDRPHRLSDYVHVMNGLVEELSEVNHTIITHTNKYGQVPNRLLDNERKVLQRFHMLLALGFRRWC